MFIFIRKTLFVGSAMLFAACSSQGPGFLPTRTAEASAPAAGALVGAAGSTASDAAAGLPGDAAAGLPGDAAAGLPGDAAAGLPGASFACAPALQEGSASCTAAININIAPLANPKTPSASIPGFH
ncbi:MAG: hypothetical protein M3N13_03210, partial [Candidatus Eremiobacteraeota bacterium]|nr:hypothetical protein [Candidatus Eremiobacteraeota bacterium]